jgi:hypothetical protein
VLSGGPTIIDLHCDPHTRKTDTLVTQCPSDGSDWVTITFTCGYCM